MKKIKGGKMAKTRKTTPMKKKAETKGRLAGEIAYAKAYLKHMRPHMSKDEIERLQNTIGILEYAYRVESKPKSKVRPRVKVKTTKMR